MKIALLSDSNWINKIEDNKLLLQAFAQMGINSEEISYDTEDCSGYDAVIIRSTWGYQNYVDDYLGYLAKISSQTLLLNPYETVKANIDKEFQYKLFLRNGIEHVQTVVLNSINIDEAEKIITDKFGYSMIVLKPNISASGQDTIKIDFNKENQTFLKEYLKRIILNDKKRVLVQRYISDIENGEFSFIYIGGRFSHAVKRFPGITYEGSNTMWVDRVPDVAMKYVDRFYDVLCPHGVLYARIDFILSEGNPKILEVELNEPDLYFRKSEENLEAVLSSFVSNTIEAIKRKNIYKNGE